MSRILLSLAFVTCCLTASSQKVFFIYLQSEAEQPFYVILSNKVHSSTASGYLILSKLHDSIYNFSVGFPSNKWPEQKFTVAIGHKDHGFLLKNFNEKGWGLFNLQTLAVQMSAGGSAKSDLPVGNENKDVSLFTAVLSKAADDPSLREKPVVFAVQREIVVPAVEVANGSAKPIAKEEVKQPAKEVGVTAKTPDGSAKPITKEEVKQPVKGVEVAAKTPDGSAPLTTKEVKEPAKTEQVVAKKEETKTVAEVAKNPDKVDPPVVKQEEGKVVEGAKAPDGSAKPTAGGSTTLTTTKQPVKEVEVAVKTPDGSTTLSTKEVKQPAKEVAEAAKTPEKVDPPVVKQEEAKVVEEAKAPDGSVVTFITKEEEEPYKRSVVKRKAESSTTEGFGLVFTDELGEGAADTIRLLIPNPKPAVEPKISEPKEEKKFLDIPVADSTQNPPPPVIATEVPASRIKKTCTVVAGESDFFFVRRTMAAEEKDDDMIASAEKYFKKKCFTTLQVKNLGTLFLNDAARFKFFEMSYSYISDAENFTSLESELKDPLYLSQFKAIVNQ